MSISSMPAFCVQFSEHKRRQDSGIAFASTTNAKGRIVVGRRPLSLRCDAPQLSDLVPAATAAYGALLLGGGLFAFARTGSKGSIFGGLTGASLMSAASYLIQETETKPAGEALAFGAAFLFSAVFGIRLAATRKVIPSAILLVLSLGAMTLFGSAYVQDKI